MSKKTNEGGIDLAIIFDTTGSMYPCLGEVRRKVDQLVDEIFEMVPNVRISIKAQGDYCDAGSTYVTKTLDFTTDRNAVKRFVRDVGRTGGGDAAECYELSLHEARSLTWTASKRRVVVLIADDVPHPVNYPANRKRLDWKNEAAMLKSAGIEVYAVQCLNNDYATSFYSGLASITGGLHLRLDQFQHVITLLLGVAAKQQSAETFQAFEADVRSQGPIGYSIEDILDLLAGRARKARKARKDGLTPVDPARFQVFEVVGNPSIRDFVESMGIEFKKGRGFYPLVTRSETIQENKEVIVEDLNTGEMFTGPQAREMIRLPYGMRGTVRPNPLPGYRVWVQSTSVNRVLRDPAFMYEVPEKG